MVHASMIHSSLFIQSQNYAVLTIFCCIKSAIKLIDWLIDASGVLEVSQRCTQVYKYTFYLPTYLLIYLLTASTAACYTQDIDGVDLITYALYRCVNQSSQPLHAFAPPRLRTACWGSVSCPLCTTGSCMSCLYVALCSTCHCQLCNVSWVCHGMLSCCAKLVLSTSPVNHCSDGLPVV